MAIYRYTGSKVWTMDFMFAGQRIRESTGVTSKTIAREVELKRKMDLRNAAAGIRKQRRPLLFSLAADEWMDLKRSALAPKTVLIEKTNLKHLKPVFGRMLVVEIEARDIAKYQEARLGEGAAPKTINLEVGTLRAILRRYKIWANIQQDVRMLPVHDEVGRAISAEEESALVTACGQSRSRSLLPFVTLAIDTGARFNVIRTLQWKRIDFINRCLTFGKDKTPSGTGRIVPLNARAMNTLEFWAAQFPKRQPEHYLFPAEKYGAQGDNFEACSYQTDPTKPLGDLKEAWEAAKKRAGAILNPDVEEAPALRCRFHDLRHTAVTRMLDAGIPIAKVAKIVGWSPATMVRMAARYGHFNLEELRGAVDSISRAEIFVGSSPVNPPGINVIEMKRRAN